MSYICYCVALWLLLFVGYSMPQITKKFQNPWPMPGADLDAFLSFPETIQMCFVE